MLEYALVKNGKSATAFTLRERPTPEPAAGEVLIQSEGFGLNFADVMARLGLYPDCPPLPVVLGYENVGRIKSVGPDVTDFLPGDRVLAFTRFGGYADHVLTPKLAVVKIPEHLTVGAATALATQYVTAYHAAYDVVNVHPGDHVVVHAAAGGVGTALVQMLLHQGCIVFGTAGSPEKMDYLRKLGVQYPINYRQMNYRAEIERLGFGKKIDVTFNPIGGKTVKEDFKLLNAGGRLVLFGASSLTEAKGNYLKMLGVLFGFGWWSPIKFVSGSKSLIGINMLRIADFKPAVLQRCMSEVVRMTQSGILKPVVGKEFDHTALAEAHDYLGNRASVGKVAIRW